MRSSLRFWLAVSLLLVAGAIVVWLKGRPEKSSKTVAWAQPQPTAAQAPALMGTPSVMAATGSARPESAAEKRLRYQLKNVDQSIEVLARVSSMILMRNALIDTRKPVELPIPSDLRASENPGAYIVQAQSAPSGDFQKMLKSAGAEIVAYVPNNAFLVKAGHDVAANLQNQSGVQSVLPYEPYYKLDTRLMKFAVDHETMADDAWLRVTLFPGASADALQPLANAVGPKEKSPFGEQVLIQPRSGTLADLAQLAEVQIIEPVNPRVVANDLTRVALGISEDTTTNANYLGLSGKGVWVNVNDIGVQSNHTALSGRVFYYKSNGAVDFDGHGTHVAATIAGGHATKIFDKLDALPTNSLRTNYVSSIDDTGKTNTYLSIDGSRTNADFRGMAHDAKLFVLPIDFDPNVNQPISDTFLIETAARSNYFTLNRTNDETLISNNSWNYANGAEYDSQAARFDAATRDALPDDIGSQPVLYVFAAGNGGFGGDDGIGGEPGSIASPGTAKNVITVGALEAPRFIQEPLTNVEERIETDDQGNTFTNKVTNLFQIFLPVTDSDNQVAAYSARGNVGIGVEGAAGRFKPDLVAPGTFIWSARSTNWNLTNDFDPLASSNVFNVLSNLNSVSTEYRYDTGTSFAAPGVSGLLALVQEFFSHRLPQDRRRNLSPALMKALLLNSARTVNSALYDWSLQPQANYQGWGIVKLANLLATTDPDTGQAVKAVLEALPEKQWPLQLIEQSATNAVATGEDRIWDLTVDTNALGLPLRFTLVWTDPPGNPQVGVKLVNDLDLTVEAGGRVFHGNDFPAGSVFTEPRDPRPSDELPIDDPFRDSLNNVEKIVIQNPSSLTDTNGQPETHFKVRVSGRRVNVKAVNDYYQATSRTNEIVQDYALVFSADDSFATNSFSKIDRVDKVSVNTNVFTQPVYNGLELTNQRSGANSPLYWTNGNTVQWRFYVFTNSVDTNGLSVLTNGEYVAFITSGPLNVGKPRNIEPDADIYVSTNPALTNLEPVVVSNAWKSVSRLGTEQVVFAPDIYVRDSAGNLTFGTNEDGTTFTNTVQVYDPEHPELGGVVIGQSKLGTVFYIGVKSEDQQAAEYSFIAISSQNPFEEDRNGVRIIHMLPAPTPVPDGAPNLPQGRRYYGIPLRGGRILDASTYFYVQHEDLGDLVGVVGHSARYAILNNHSLPEGFSDPMSIVYSSSPYAPYDKVTGTYNEIPVTEYPPSLYFPAFPNPPGKPRLFRPDGPGDLSTYVGADAAPVWTFDMIDSASSHTGIVSQVEMHVRPLRKPLINGVTIADTVKAGGQNFYPLDLPNDATKVTLTLSLDSGVADTNILMLVSKDVIPATNQFDYMATFTVGGPSTITLTFDRNSQPPLVPGEYIIGIVNTGPIDEAFHLTAVIDSDSSGTFRDEFGDSFVFLDDDNRTISQGDYALDRIVTDASVAILAPDIRESDYVLRLTSPQGTSVILSENRGSLDQGGFGSSVPFIDAEGNLTNSYALFTDNLGPMIKFTLPPFGDSAASRGLVFRSSFEKAIEGTYTAPAIMDGWNVTSNQVYAVWGEAAEGNIFVNLGLGGAITNTLPTTKGRPYKLSFAYRGKPTAAAFSAAGDFSHTSNPNDAWTYGYRPPQGTTFTPMAAVAKVSSNPDVWFWEGFPAAPPFFGEPTIGKNEGASAFIINGTTVYGPGAFALHPGPNGERATLRWTSPGAGVYHVAASFRGGDAAGSRDVHIEVGGTQVYSVIVNGNQLTQTYTNDFTVAAGAIIDFMVGSNGPYFNDTTITTVTITSLMGAVYGTGQIDSSIMPGAHTNLPPGSMDRHFRIVNNPDPNFAPPPGQDGSELFVAAQNSPPFPTWFVDDGYSQWLALKPQSDDGHPAGSYTNRTSFVLTGLNPADVSVKARIAADDSISAILLNNANVPPLITAGPGGYSTPFVLSGFRTGLNTIDFVVQNAAVGPEGFRADLSMTLANARGISPVTNTTVGFVRLTSGAGGNPGQFRVSGGPQWQRFETEFIAPSDNIGIEFFATKNFPGVDIDDIVLEDTGTKFLLPEEPLAILQNERAMGEWKLEAIDNRTGGVNPAIILDWKLILGVAMPPRVAEPLESGVVYPTVIHHPIIQANTNVYTPGRIFGGETEYFYFDVCANATEAKIQLFGSKTNSIALELLVDRSGFPTGDPTRDDYAIIRTTAGTNSTVTLPLTLEQPIAAPLQPGKRLFIAVRGAEFPLTTNETFTIRVLPNGCGPITLPLLLVAGDSMSSTSFPGEPGDDGTTYQTSTNVTSVTLTADGTLTFLASNGVEPTMSNYQIKQTVSSSSANIALPTTGTWYFRIVNESGVTVPYTLSAEAQSASAIRNVAVVDNHLTVSWQTVIGAQYEIATSIDLVNWTPVTTVQASSTETTYTDTSAVGGTSTFIRIRPL